MQVKKNGQQPYLNHIPQGVSSHYLEVVSKPHLRLNGCVVPRIEMLTYSRVRSAFNSRNALPLNLIWDFEPTSSQFFSRILLNQCFTGIGFSVLAVFSEIFQHAGHSRRADFSCKIRMAFFC
jgi:hypothetical protein